MSAVLEHNLTHYCSFCGKSQYEALCLVAGPTVFICDDCTEVCRDIVGKHRLAQASRIEAQRGETRSGSISEADESLTAESGDAQTQDPSPRECK